jgi:sacsin
MKTILKFKIQMESRESSQKWLVVQYFHAGTTNETLSQLIGDPRCKHRPYGGIAARLDAPIPSGQIFCFLPLPSTHESSTGLPVHVHGCFALDSNRQHLKWPSHDQTVSNSYLEKDMAWNVLMVEDVLPRVYKEFLHSWRDDKKCDMANHLEMFYHYLPRPSKVRHPWKRICEVIQTHVSNFEIPCLKEGNWIKLQDAYFAVFKDDISMNMQLTVRKLFELCMNKTIMLGENADLYDEWLKITSSVAHCTSPKETRRVLKNHNIYEQLSPEEKAHLLVYCCSDEEVSLDELELIPMSNGCFEKFSKRNSQKKYYLCEENELELLVGMEACLVQYCRTEVGQLLQSLASSGKSMIYRISGIFDVTIIFGYFGGSRLSHRINASKL